MCHPVIVKATPTSSEKDDRDPTELRPNAANADAIAGHCELAGRSDASIREAGEANNHTETSFVRHTGAGDSAHREDVGSGLEAIAVDERMNLGM